jgi:two-component system cell cycle sensor histidine kinase/response regulator CckA
MSPQAAELRESSRLLVVDDEDGVRKYISRVLSQAGYAVETAGSAAEGLKAVQRGATFDLIVSDVRMPQMTGPQFIAEVRRQESAVKVLYLTGYADQLFDEREMLWEDEAFLDKPCSPNSLLESVSLLLFGRIIPPGTHAGGDGHMH